MQLEAFYQALYEDAGNYSDASEPADKLSFFRSGHMVAHMPILSMPF